MEQDNSNPDNKLVDDSRDRPIDEGSTPVAEPLLKKLRWNEKIPPIIGIIQATIACVTLPIIILQLHNAADARRLDTQTRLFSHSLDILKQIQATPNAYDFIYGGKKLTEESTPSERQTAEITALMYMDMFEHICLQAPALEPHTREAWVIWVKDMYVGSPAIQKLYAKEKKWYSKELRQILDSP